MEILLAIFTIIICLIATYTDWQSRVVPNYLNLTGFLIIFIILILSLNSTELQPYLWSGLISVIVMLLLFYTKILGGGDAKLLMILGFSVPIQSLIYLWLYVSIIGGLQALFFIIKYKKTKQTIPYAFAILGGVILFWVEFFAIA